MNANDTEPNCWICLEEGPDDEGQELMSGCCSCRGTSGYVHFSCIKRFAQLETRKAAEQGVVDKETLDKIW
jgi:E3 ubiquitin-protein ligase DOA10